MKSTRNPQSAIRNTESLRVLVPRRFHLELKNRIGKAGEQVRKWAGENSPFPTCSPAHLLPEFLPPSLGAWARRAVAAGGGGSSKFILLFLSFLIFNSTAHAVTFKTSTATDGSPRIYVIGPGLASLSDIKTAVPKAKLEQIAPGVWHLRANLYLSEGAKLVLYGTKIGGDCNELRLQSNNTGAANEYMNITADYGEIDIRSTTITSWDDAAQGPDTEFSAFRRAFIRIRSTLDTNGVTAHESRMDIQDSDIGYLGSHNAEAYGLVWKVLEAKDPAARPYGALTNLYSLVNVYGNILRSRLHHMYFGMYSFGAYGMQMMDNEVDHNIGYGFDPHDDSDYLVIERNNVHHNGTHGIIASQRCNNTTIRDNISWNNGRQRNCFPGRAGRARTGQHHLVFKN